jgi:hypothetical protein
VATDRFTAETQRRGVEPMQALDGVGAIGDE